MTFDLSTRRRALINMRAELGAQTRPGHICSDVVEEMENWETAKAEPNEFQMGRLRMLMPRRIGIISKARTLAASNGERGTP